MRIVACFFGDGAACEGIFHESVNLAAVWNLPVLYICENNEWQAFVHRRETMLIDHISARAAGYGIEGLTVDGNDVEAVYKAAAEAIRKIRETASRSCWNSDVPTARPLRARRSEICRPGGTSLMGRAKIQSAA